MERFEAANDPIGTLTGEELVHQASDNMASEAKLALSDFRDPTKTRDLDTFRAKLQRFNDLPAELRAKGIVDPSNDLGRQQTRVTHPLGFEYLMIRHEDGQIELEEVLSGSR